MNSAGMPRGYRGALAPSGQASPRSLRVMPEELCADTDLPGGHWMQCGCGPRSARGRGSDLQRRPLPGGDLSASSRPRTRVAVGLPTHGEGWVNLPICDCITPAESSRESPHSPGFRGHGPSASDRAGVMQGGRERRRLSSRPLPGERAVPEMDSGGQGSWSA